MIHREWEDRKAWMSPCVLSVSVRKKSLGSGLGELACFSLQVVGSRGWSSAPREGITEAETPGSGNTGQFLTFLPAPVDGQ